MSESTVERILAARERAHIEAEAYALKLGLPLLFRYYCLHCHRHHEITSEIGRAHEGRAANPKAVLRAKRDRFEVLPGFAAPSPTLAGEAGE